jgi:hypothetical protein
MTQRAPFILVLLAGLGCKEDEPTVIRVPAYGNGPVIDDDWRARARQRQYEEQIDELEDRLDELESEVCPPNRIRCP